MTFVWISFGDGENCAYPVDTMEEIRDAKAAMRTCGVRDYCPVYVGDPDGDNHQNGQRLYADQCEPSTGDNVKLIGELIERVVRLENDVYRLTKSVEASERRLCSSPTCPRCYPTVSPPPPPAP